MHHATNTMLSGVSGVSMRTSDDPGQVTPIGPKVETPRGLYVGHGQAVHMIVYVNAPLLMQSSSSFTDQQNPLARQRIPSRDRI
jgi:hypothetical protein